MKRQYRLTITKIPTIKKREREKRKTSVGKDDEKLEPQNTIDGNVKAP